MSDQNHPAGQPAILRLEPGEYRWCGCDKSAKRPFCDTTQAECSSASVPFEIAKTRNVALCCCEHTNTPPFCDGSHAKL